MAEQPFLSVRDVAKRFRVNPTTIYHLAQKGLLPGFKVGNQWRFSQDMLEVWVARQMTSEQIRNEEMRRNDGEQELEEGNGHVR